MPLSKEEKARRRALSAMQAGRHFHARGSAKKALLEESRAEVGTGLTVRATASSSRKRVRVEQIGAMSSAPAPSAAVLSDQDEEEEELLVPPESAEPVARAPAESFESVLATRAAQALARQMGAPEPPPLPPWFRDNVLAFYRSSEAFKLRSLCRFGLWRFWQTPDQMCWKHLEQYTQLAGGP